MPRTCTVCSSEYAIDVNEALVLERKSNRAISQRYGLSADAVQRHRGHIPQMLRRAADAESVANADTLLELVTAMIHRLENILDEAERARTFDTFIRGATALRPYLELLGELRKELERRPEINVIISGEAQRAIINALSSYPEARGAVIGALAELEEAS